MKLLMISTDRRLFIPDSQVWSRIKKIKEKYDEIHVIVFSLKKLSLDSMNISDGIFLYPTNSLLKFLYIIDAVICGVKIIKNNNFLDTDLITCQDPFEVGLAGHLLKKISKIKLELQIHTDLYSPFYCKHSLLNRLRLVISKVILVKADSIRVVSKRIADSLVQRGINSNKIIIKPIVVDTEGLKARHALFNLKEKFPNYKKIILMVSRLEIEKNIDGAIRGFSLIIRENPGLGLVIVGDGSEEGRLKKDVARLKIGPQVAFEGWQSDIISYYKGCDCVLVTSWYEGYGMVYKEAEALNCRIVSTDVGIARDIGAVIVGWEPEEIARGLRRVL